MIFKYVIILSILFYGSSNGLTLFRDVENLIGTPIQTCLNCLCHARTGCFNRLTCARYSISQDYWKAAGAPTINRNLGEAAAYSNCMSNENCVINAIKMYTDSFGKIDCNYDGKFDCMDRLAIHVNGDSCHSRALDSAFSNRFNGCSGSITAS